MEIPIFLSVFGVRFTHPLLNHFSHSQVYGKFNINTLLFFSHKDHNSNEQWAYKLMVGMEGGDLNEIALWSI